MNSHPTFKTSLSRSFLLASLAAGIGLGSTVALAADEAAKPAARSDGLGAALNDSAITTRVKAKLMGESSLKNSDISVTTTNGVVTLEGQASSGEAKSAAESATRAVDGVRSVDNNLKTPSASSAGARQFSHVTTGRFPRAGRKMEKCCVQLSHGLRCCSLLRPEDG